MKKAFSLAEMLLVTVVISVLSMLAIQTFKPSSEHYRQLYLTAYDTLVQAAGNAYLSWNPECACNTPEITTDSSGKINVEIREDANFCWSKDCWIEYTTPMNITNENSQTTTIEENEEGGVIGYPREYPGYLFGRTSGGGFNGTGTDEAFCKLLTENINTVDQNNECISFISGINPELDRTKGEDFQTAFCALISTSNKDKGNSTTNDALIQCSEEKSIIPSFIASNGQRFYISTVLTANVPCAHQICLSDEAFIGDENNPAAVARRERIQFRLVAVDLNGTKAPNTQLQRGTVRPDTVLFALKSDGTVVPLGRPEMDQAYLSTYVEYPEFQNVVANGEYVRNTNRTSESMSLSSSKMHAWGFEAKTQTPNFAEKWLYLGHPLLLNEPYSYSGFFYEIATGAKASTEGGSEDGSGSCNLITGCKDADLNSKGSVYADTLAINLIRQFLYIKKGNSKTLDQVDIPSEILVTPGPSDPEEGNLPGTFAQCEYDKGCVCNMAASKCKVNYK